MLKRIDVTMKNVCGRRGFEKTKGEQDENVARLIGGQGN